MKLSRRMYVYLIAQDVLVLTQVLCLGHMHRQCQSWPASLSPSRRYIPIHITSWANKWAWRITDNEAVVRSPSEVTHAFDYVVLAHKAIDQDAVASQMQSAVNASTTMVIIQNGVGNEGPFRRLYPGSSILTCVV